MQRASPCWEKTRHRSCAKKYDSYCKEGVSIHFIGHLQTNKVRQIIDKVCMIESVDSVKLAREIERQCANIGKVMDVLVEVNIGAEESKSGFLPSSCPRFCRKLPLEHIRVRGLMTIPPVCEDEQQVSQYFFPNEPTLY